MAWTAPRTWSVGEVVTSTLLNTHLRDNLLAGMDRGTTLPSSPSDGELYCYVADSSNGVEWLLKYNAGEAGPYKWRCIGGTPLRTYVATAEARNNASYGALTTALQVTVPLAGDYDVFVTATSLGTSNTAGVAYSSYTVGGTAASDVDALVNLVAAGATYFTQSGTKRSRKTGISASTVLAMQHKNTGSVSTTYSDRELAILPVRVG